MDKDIVLWIVGAVVTVNTAVLMAIGGVVWTLVRQLQAYSSTAMATMADYGARLTRVEEDIGTHDSGMRGDIHKLRNETTPVVIWFQHRKGPNE